MVWVVGIALGLLLLFAFPKQMGALLLLLVVGAGLLFAAMQNAEQRRAEQYQKREESIALSAVFNMERCSADFPILITIANQYTETIQSLSFELAGYREGYSSPVYKGRAYRSDRIIPPGQTYASCWAVPSLDYAAQAAPPQILIWRAHYSYATFGEASF